ncbi:Protein of unknown function, partial [Gryllus bimaculatus]
MMRRQRVQRLVARACVRGERPPSAASRPLSSDEGDAGAAGPRASLERQAVAAAAEEAEKPSE